MLEIIPSFSKSRREQNLRTTWKELAIRKVNAFITQSQITMPGTWQVLDKHWELFISCKMISNYLKNKCMSIQKLPKE